MTQPASRKPHHQRLTAERVTFTDQQVRDAVEFIASTGVLGELAPLLDHPVGRRRLLSLEGLLAGMRLCSAVHSGRVLLDQVTSILHWSIPQSWREHFGVPERPDNATGFEAAYAVVRRLFHGLVKTIDPSPLPKNKRLDKREKDRLILAANHDVLGQNRDRLVQVTNAILEASLAPVRELLGQQWDGSLGLDATPMGTWARGTKSNGPVTSTDPDAGWYVRDGDHADPDLKTKQHKAKPGKRRQPKYQLGIQGSAHGALLIDGNWCCPSTPEPLANATRDFLDEKIDAETWRNRISARDAYRLAPKGMPAAEGHQRIMCPAAAGRAQCPLKTASMGSSTKLTLITPESTPAGLPKICRQDSITIAPEHGAKDWQPLAHGSPQWQQHYFTGRNSVEGINGYAKDVNHEAFQQAGTRRVRGIAAQSLLAAFQLAHANQRKIARWQDTIPDENGQTRRRERRRTTEPIGTWTPGGFQRQKAA